MLENNIFFPLATTINQVIGPPKWWQNLSMSNMELYKFCLQLNWFRCIYQNKLEQHKFYKMQHKFYKMQQ